MDKVVKENIRLHEEEAENYETKQKEIFNEREQGRIKSVLDESKSYIESDDTSLKALDVGCGTGNILEKLIPLFDKVVGIDLSQDMLSNAVDNFQEGETPYLIRGRAADLPFPKNHFHMVSAYSVLHHLPQFDGAISEISRVLKPGGVLYIDHEPINREDRLVKLYMKFRDLLNEKSVEGLPPYEETDDRNREYCDYHIHNGEVAGIPTSKITGICEENGLEIMETREYLSYGTNKKNLLHPCLEPLIASEWLLIGKNSHDTEKPHLKSRE